MVTLIVNFSIEKCHQGPPLVQETNVLSIGTQALGKENKWEENKIGCLFCAL